MRWTEGASAREISAEDRTMEFTRFKTVVAAPSPEVRYATPSPEELAAGGPLDADRGRHLASGEAYASPVAAQGGSWPATFDSAVQFVIEPCDPGRCAQCRDNSRKRFSVRATDQHGMRKWCPFCLEAKLGVTA